MLLLTTKLYPLVTRDRSRLVSRQRLVERLNDALRSERPLLLISAPAGCGKTTLLGEWVQQSQRRVAWLSLDEGDNDPARFWSYVIASLQTAQDKLGANAQAILEAAGEQALPLEALLTALLNELAAEPEGVTLVLEDYHVITTAAIHDGLTFLLDHLPPQIQIIIASRADPPMPLARLRAGNRMTEIRADDLRFTPGEVAAFLNDGMGLHLSPDDVAALEARTEGWIVGLQLAGLSLQGRDETAQHRFVSAFTGSQRYILDYLAEEVLLRQPEAIQAFLLETCILGRLSAALCEAVTGRADSQAMLEELERNNLFVISLDDERHWYRYHHLFAEVLRARLQQKEPERPPELHRRAAAWCEANQLIDAARRHALAAGDAAWAARLVEQHVEELLRRGEGETLRRWLAAVPEEVARARPRLSLARAIAASNAGHLAEAEALLVDAERAQLAWPDEPYEPSIGWELSMLANVPASIALLRATTAGLRGDAERTTELVQLAQTHLGAAERGPRLSVRWNLALADWLRGQLTEAEQAFTDILAVGRGAAEPHLVLSASAMLSRIRQAQGRLGAAQSACQEALELAERAGPAALLSASIAQVGLAAVLYERNQLDEARRLLTTAIPLARQLASTMTLATALTTQAWIEQASGEAGREGETMEEAYQVMPSLDIVSLQNPVPAERARLMLAQGDVAAAARWVAARGLAEGDPVSFAREREYLVLARLLLAEGRPELALGLLARLGAAAAAQARTGSVIEVRVLEALGLKAAGQPAQALDALVLALALARPEGYARVFLDGGAPLADLLRQVAGEQRPYAEQLLAEWDRARSGLNGASHSLPPAQAPRAALVEPLTERELQVLRLLVAGLSNSEIAQKLYLSAGTVKVHLKHIYGKLDVNRRTQAVARAGELNLL
jgi:LuxR family maltose regulon positive regulatory protein